MIAEAVRIDTSLLGALHTVYVNEFGRNVLLDQLVRVSGHYRDGHEDVDEELLQHCIDATEPLEDAARLIARMNATEHDRRKAELIGEIRTCAYEML